MELSEIRPGMRLLVGPSRYWDKSYPCLRPGTVLRVLGARVRVQLDDGTDRLVAPQSVQPLRLARHYPTVTPLTPADARAALAGTDPAAGFPGTYEPALRALAGEATPARKGDVTR